MKKIKKNSKLDDIPNVKGEGCATVEDVADGKISAPIVPWSPVSLPAVDRKFALQCLAADNNGLARFFVYLVKDMIRYVVTWDCWLLWRGHAFEVDKKNQVPGLIDIVVEILVVILNGIPKDEKESLRKLLIKKIKWLRSLSGQREILEQAKSIWDDHGVPYLTVTADQLDLQIEQIPCAPAPGEKQGVVVDLLNGRPRPGRIWDLATLTCPTPWLGLDEPAPRWRQFLAECQPDQPDVVDFLQRFCGYALLRRCILAVFLIIIGAGRNGKSLFLEIISCILGTDLVVNLPPEIVVKQPTRSASAPGGPLLDTKGKSLVILSELERTARMAQAAVKKFSGGGDTLTDRRPFEPAATTFKPTATWVMATNFIPRTDGDDEALFERLLVVDFPVKFVLGRDPDLAAGEAVADPDLKRKLQAEAPGILAWLVQGALLYQRDGLQPPPAVLARTAQLKEDDDLVGAWIDACVDRDTTEFTSAKRLYDSFCNWMEENRAGKPWGSRTFYLAIGRRAQKKRTGAGKLYNLKLIDL